MDVMRRPTSSHTLSSDYQPLYVTTPTFESKILSDLTQKKILLKMECFQPTSSFKIRGIGHLCQALVSTGHEHLVASSGGNAGYAVAYAARRLNVSATVFVPKTTNAIYLKYLESEGAKVNIAGDVWDEAHQAAMNFVGETNAAYIPPFDHPLIWEGHATLVDELVHQIAKPDAIISAVGGGGLLCGILEGLSHHNWLNTEIFSVETEGAASFAASLKAGELVTLERVSTIATSLAAKRVAPHLFEWSRKQLITPLIVTDEACIRACRKFADDHHILVEPACGAALSTIYDIHRFSALNKAETILVIVCGGVGMSLKLMDEYAASLQSRPK